MLELGSCLAWPPCLQIFVWLVSDTMLLCLHVIRLEAFRVLQFKLASQALSYFTFCFHNITYPYLIFPSSVISLLLEFYAPGSTSLSQGLLSGTRHMLKNIHERNAYVFSFKPFLLFLFVMMVLWKFSWK